MDWVWIGSVIDNRQWRAWLHFGDGGIAPDNGLFIVLYCQPLQCIRLYWLVPKTKLNAKSQHQIVLNLQLPLFFWAMLQPTIFLQKNNLHWEQSCGSDNLTALTKNVEKVVVMLAWAYLQLHLTALFAWFFADGCEWVISQWVSGTPIIISPTRATIIVILAITRASYTK